MKIEYPAILSSAEEGGYLVNFPDFEGGVFTEGEALEDTLHNATEVLDLVLEDRLAKGEQIPEPGRSIEGAYMISPDAKIQSALLVRFTRGSRPLTDLAKSLKTSWPAASRLEDPRHWPSLRQLDKAAQALGKQLILSFK